MQKLLQYFPERTIETLTGTGKERERYIEAAELDSQPSPPPFLSSRSLRQNLESNSSTQPTATAFSKTFAKTKKCLSPHTQEEKQA